MLTITVPEWEDWDPVKQMFVSGKATVLTMEHSLLSLSKWESVFHKSFLNNKNITAEEMLAYIRFMTLTKDVDPAVYLHLTSENMKTIDDYINDPMTATTFSGKNNKKPSKKIITNELIYWWMVSLGIPFECQKWHLNRLMTLIRVANIKSQPSKKMNKKEQGAQARSLNAMRRARSGSKG